MADSGKSLFCFQLACLINTLIRNARIEQRHKAFCFGNSNTTKQIGFLPAISERLTPHVLEKCCLRVDTGQ
jgi:hypothetical protein